MRNSSIELRHEAGVYYLQIERQSSVELSQLTFTRLARQFVAAAHSIPQILEPPFVVRLHAQYNVDGDQQTPIFVEDLAFMEHLAAEELLAQAQTDIAQFACRWPFRLWIPAVPEHDRRGPGRFSPLPLGTLL